MNRPPHTSNTTRHADKTMPARFWASRSELERLKKEVKKLCDGLREVKLELEVVRREADEQWTLPDALNAHNAVDGERVYDPESQVVTRVVLEDAVERVRCRCGDQPDAQDAVAAPDESRVNRQETTPEEPQGEDDLSSPSKSEAAAPEEESTASSPVSSTGRSFFNLESSSRSSLFDFDPHTRSPASPTQGRTTTGSQPTKAGLRRPVPSKSPPVAQTISITPRGRSPVRPASSRLDFTRERFESSVRDYHIRRYG